MAKSSRIRIVQPSKFTGIFLCKRIIDSDRYRNQQPENGETSIISLAMDTVLNDTTIIDTKQEKNILKLLIVLITT